MKSRNAVAAQPEYLLKHRLAGAVIIAGVATMMVVWLLSKPVTEAGGGGGNLVSTPINFHADPVPASVERNNAERSADSQPQPKPALVALEANNSTQTQTTPTNAERKPSVPPTSTEGWAVHVGVFSKQAGIDSVSARLKEIGFDVRQTDIKTTRGDDATRIWLGPYASRKTAETVSARTHAITGEKGLVAKHAP